MLPYKIVNNNKSIVCIASILYYLHTILLWYVYYGNWRHRFGKSTHISMISNSVTHLRSYTNSAIAGNSAPISPVTPCDRRHRSGERRYYRIEWWVFECFMMFHNVLRLFYVLLVVNDVLRCITMFYMCFMMFYCVWQCFMMFSVSRNDRRRRIVGRRSPQGSRQRRSDQQ